jgi:DNA polymerase-3 subunit delta'
MWPLIGQERTVAWLEQGLKRGRVSHAYLFLGPPHIGKTSLAICLAQALNCKDLASPCGQCASCRRIAAGKHTDVQIIKLLKNPEDGKDAKEISIDQIKDLQQQANLPPYEGIYKVFIIAEAERLSTEASNRLLKTLEEPPAHVVIILLASAEERLLPTVISRCQRLDLRPIPAAQLEKALIEREDVEADLAKRLAHLANGCPGLALSQETRKNLLDERPKRLAGLLELDGVGSVERFKFAATLAEKFSKQRAFVEDELKLWRGWWRDLLLTKAGLKDSVVNIDMGPELEKRVQNLSLSQISGFLSDLGQAVIQLEQNANPRLVLEVLMLNLPRLSLAQERR